MAVNAGTINLSGPFSSKVVDASPSAIYYEVKTHGIDNPDYDVQLGFARYGTPTQETRFWISNTVGGSALPSGDVTVGGSGTASMVLGFKSRAGVVNLGYSQTYYLNVQSTLVARCRMHFYPNTEAPLIGNDPVVPPTVPVDPAPGDGNTVTIPSQPAPVKPSTLNTDVAIDTYKANIATPTNLEEMRRWVQSELPHIQTGFGSVEEELVKLYALIDSLYESLGSSGATFTLPTNTGPQGPAGADGADGVDGVDGEDGNAGDLLDDTSSRYDRAYSSHKTEELLAQKANISDLPSHFLTTVTADYTVPDVEESTIVCNNTVDITVTLPALDVGQIISVNRGNTGIVDVTGSDLISGETTQRLPMEGDTISMIGTSIGWAIV